MRSKIQSLLISLTLALILASGLPALAQTAESPLRVAIKEVPPFAMKGEDGNWHGLSVGLWKAIALDNGYAFDFVETNLEGMLRGLEAGTFDAGVGALSVTADREEKMDFSYPFFQSSLGVATGTQNRFWTGLRSVPWLALLSAVGVIFGLMLLAGALVWLAERRHNREAFESAPVKGIASGLWWAAVTLTTVGYGDKAPVTFAGRAIAVLWMLSSVVVTASFTAAITSALTLSSLSSAINGPQDLGHRRVGSVPGSSSADFLRTRRIAYAQFESVSAGLDGIADGDIDLFVYDRPILRFVAGTRNDGKIRVLRTAFEPQGYAIGLPTGSPLRENIDRTLLEYLAGQEWRDAQRIWMGQD